MSKFSIIVPVYNVEKYIRYCIDSIQNQTLKDLEIILVDDGSTDQCSSIIDEYANQDKRIKVIHKKNSGVDAARNDGLHMATGEYVLFCDPDDFMEIDACEKLYEAGSKNQADVVLGDVYRIINGEKQYAQFFSKPFCTDDRAILDNLIRVDFSRKFCHDAPKGGPAFGYGGPWNKAIRREFLTKNGICFDETLKGVFDDILFTAYLYAVATRVVYITDPVYDYRLLGDSGTRSYKEDILKINQAIFAAWRIFLDKYGNDGCFDDAYEALVIRRLKGTLGAYFFNEKNPLSVREQKTQLKALLKQEPYRSAIRSVDPRKLINLYDLAVWMMAKLHSVFGLQMVYRTFLILRKV